MTKQEHVQVQRSLIEGSLAQAALRYTAPVVAQTVVRGAVVQLLGDGSIRWGFAVLSPSCGHYPALLRAVKGA